MMPSAGHNSVASSTPSQQTDALRALLVVDDPTYCETLADELSKEGFAIRSFSDGASLLSSLNVVANADVFVLCSPLSKTSAGLLLQLRQRGVELPVTFLAGDCQTSCETRASDSNRIDFVDDLRGAEMFAKGLKRVVDAAHPEGGFPHGQRLVCGKLVLEPEVSRAYWNGMDLGLTLGEYKILHLLVSNVGRYVTYRNVYDRLHYEGFIAGSGTDGYKGNVRSQIKRIRNKFRACDPDFSEIQNYISFGYCWRKPA